jgi:hypothetical protein
LAAKFADEGLIPTYEHGDNPGNNETAKPAAGAPQLYNQGTKTIPLAHALADSKLIPTYEHKI